ncbi:unnamed protein product [Orchesella dallaii]|uniref:DUF4789 domain-containing protein n=1 Tax=Orchesella dallaii TaxID=48710 RepID=A0ABP1PWY7_9HEXA
MHNKMSKMHLQIVAILAFWLATELPVMVTGRPQIQLGGIRLGPGADGPSGNGEVSKPTESTGGLKVIADKPELNGMIQLQVFVGKENSNDLVKVHESNSSFALAPTPDDSEMGDKLKSKCSEGEFLYEADDNCYLKGDFTEGIPFPCNHNFQTYSERVDKPGYGECTCRRFKPPTTRPVVHWKENNQCYWLYDQGPCTEGQWLVFNNETNADGSKALICTKRTCPETSEEDSKAFFPKFIFVHKGKCLKTETKNPELCGNDRNMVYFAVDKPEPVCLQRRPVIPYVKGLASGVGSLSCKAGFKKLPNGDCKRTASFDFK